MSTNPEAHKDTTLIELVTLSDDIMPDTQDETFGDKIHKTFMEGTHDLIDILPFRRRRIAQFAKKFSELRTGRRVFGNMTTTVFEDGTYRKLHVNETKIGDEDTTIDSVTVVASSLVVPGIILASRAEVHRIGGNIDRETEAVFPFTPGRHPLETRWIGKAINSASAIQNTVTEYS